MAQRARAQEDSMKANPAEAAPVEVETAETTGLVALLKDSPVVTSANTDLLDAALAAAQAEFPPIPKTKTAKTGTYSYDYADLADVLRICTPVLAKHGIAVTQHPFTMQDGAPGVLTRVAHNGQFIASAFSIRPMKGDPQSTGTAITYARRYSYQGAVGVFSESDDDANSIQGTGATITQKPSTRVAPRTTEKITQEQVEELRSLGDAGFVNWPKFCTAMQVEALEDLPAEKYETVKRMMLSKAKAAQQEA